jgi:hypothetical protein
LLFSLLYGAEFLPQLEVVRQCEAAWWAGVRRFYGFPNGVSSAFLTLLFPSFSLVHKVMEGKLGLLLRGSRFTETLFPEAILCDRAVLFQRYRCGFTQVTKLWAEQLGVTACLFEGDRIRVRVAIQAAKERVTGEAWARFSTMPSTSFAAAVFGSKEALYQTILAASRYSRLGVRASVLTISGSLGYSYLRAKRCDSCNESLSFQHLLDCPELGSPVTHVLSAAVGNRDWDSSAVIILSRFEVFLHRVKEGNFTADETELFEALVTGRGDEDAS